VAVAKTGGRDITKKTPTPPLIFLMPFFPKSKLIHDQIIYFFIRIFSLIT